MTTAKQPPQVEPLFPQRVFLKPPVVMEFLFGVSPLFGIAWFGWDVFLVLTLHLLALAVSAFWLAMRMLALSNRALGHLVGGRNRNARLLGARLGYTAFTLFVFGMPLALFTAMLTEQHGGIWFSQVHGVGDFWRVVVVSSGLWVPLAAACAWEAVGFVADTALPRLPFQRRFDVPVRSMAPEHSPELRAFLMVRALVVLRMLVTTFAVGVGMFVGELLGAIAIVVVLVVLKTAVAMIVEASWQIDGDKRIAERFGRRKSRPQTS
jgi:hypothetical protein